MTPMRAVLSFSVLACASVCALAQTAVTLSTGNDYAPFVHSQAPEGGMATAIVRQALSAQKQAVELNQSNWSKAMELAKTGGVAGSFVWFKTAEREADFIFSDSIYDVEEVAFTKPDSKLDFSKPASLEGSTVCLPSSWAASPSIASMVASGKIKRAEPRDASLCVRMVISGKADYFITDRFQGAASIKAAGATDAEIMTGKQALTKNGLFLIAPKSKPESAGLIKTFNAGLADIKKNGKYAEIVKKFTQ